MNDSNETRNPGKDDALFKEGAAYSTLTFLLPILNDPIIYPTLETLQASFGDLPMEILIVDDGNDEDFDKLNQHISDKNYSNVRVVKGKNKGLGSAIKVGALNAKGDVVFYMDADLPIPLDWVRKFIYDIVVNDYDMVMAQRPLSKKKFKTNPFRFLLSSGLQTILGIFIFHTLSIFDTQAGFKAYKRKVILEFAERQTIDMGMFNVEHLYIARKQNLKVKRVIIEPNDEVRSTRINIGRSIVIDPLDLIRIKINGVMGKYSKGGNRTEDGIAHI